MPEILASNIWWIAALLGSVFSALYYTINQFYKVPAITLMFWRGLIPTLILTPAVLYMEWPESPYFYLFSVSAGILALFLDTGRLHGSAKYGGGITTRMRPLSLFMVFAIWLVIDADNRNELLSEPLKFTAITTILCIASGSLLLLKKSPVSKEALLYFLPIAMLAAAVSVLNKGAMDSSTLLAGILCYSFIQSLIITLGAFSTHIVHHTLSVSHIFDKNVMMTGLAIGLSFLVFNLSKNTAMTFATNPAYVVAIIQTAPFWVSLYYKTVQHKENEPILPGFIFVISAIVLVLLTSSL